MEKDLRDDVRVRRMAHLLNRQYLLFKSAENELDPCNACAFPGVTLVLGCLQRLWMHADSFARDDDTLDITPAEIDQLTGIEGFAEILPADWLEVLDEYSVKLPGFQEHNGTEAKRKALTAKRVTRHRIKVKRTSVTKCNAPALPDQTRPDQDQTKSKKALRAATFVPDSIPGLSLEAWNRWTEYRMERKPPIKPESMREAAQQLADFGIHQLEVVKQSIAAGWQGLFALKTVNGSPGKPWKAPRSTAEILEEEAHASQPAR